MNFQTSTIGGGDLGTNERTGFGVVIDANVKERTAPIVKPATKAPADETGKQLRELIKQGSGGWWQHNKELQGLSNNLIKGYADLKKKGIDPDDLTNEEALQMQMSIGEANRLMDNSKQVREDWNKTHEAINAIAKEKGKRPEEIFDEEQLLEFYEYPNQPIESLIDFDPSDPYAENRPKMPAIKEQAQDFYSYFTKPTSNTEKGIEMTVGTETYEDPITGRKTQRQIDIEVVERGKIKDNLLNPNNEYAQDALNYYTKKFADEKGIDENEAANLYSNEVVEYATDKLIEGRKKYFPKTSATTFEGEDNAQFAIGGASQTGYVARPSYDKVTSDTYSSLGINMNSPLIENFVKKKSAAENARAITLSGTKGKAPQPQPFSISQDIIVSNNAEELGKGKKSPSEKQTYMYQPTKVIELPDGYIVYGNFSKEQTEDTKTEGTGKGGMLGGGEMKTTGTKSTQQGDMAVYLKKKSGDKKDFENVYFDGVQIEDWMEKNWKASDDVNDPLGILK